MDSVTRKKLDDIFSYGGNSKNTFPIERLLGAPDEILRYCMNWDAPNISEIFYDHFQNPESPNFDSRLGKSCRDDVPASEFISERGIKKFVEDYVDYIDLNKLTLFAFFKLKVSLQTISNQDKSRAFIYKSYMDAMTSSFKSLIRQYKMQDTILYLLQEKESNPGEYELFDYTGEQLLLDKKPQRRKLPLSNDELDIICNNLSPITFPSVIDDLNLVDLVSLYISKLSNNPSEVNPQLIKNLLDVTTIRNHTDVGKLFLMTGFAISKSLTNIETSVNEQNYSQMNSQLLAKLDILRDFMRKIPEGTVIGKDAFTKYDLLDEIQVNLTTGADKIFSYDPDLVIEYIRRGYIGKDVILPKVEKSKDPENLIGICWGYSIFDVSEVEQLAKAKRFNMSRIQDIALKNYLEAHDAEIEDYSSYPYIDKKTRLLFNDENFAKLVAGLIKGYKGSNTKKEKHGKRLVELSEYKFINSDYVKKLLIDSKINADDIDAFNEFIEDYDLPEYEGFKFDINKLFDYYKLTHDELLNKALSDEGESYDDRPIVGDLGDAKIQLEYEFLKKYYLERVAKNPGLRKEFVDLCDIYALYPTIAKNLYSEGLIDIQTLKELIDDSGIDINQRETSKMLLDGQIRSSDVRFVIHGNNLGDNPLLLTDLYSQGQITYQEIIEKFLNGEVSHDTVVKFAEGRDDFDSAFSTKRYLELFSNAVKSYKDDEMIKFKNYYNLLKETAPDFDLDSIRADVLRELKKNARNDRLEKLYLNDLIDGKILKDLLDASQSRDTELKNKGVMQVVANLVVNQNLKMNDARILFRDEGSTLAGRKRLDFIFGAYHLTDDQKINILIQTYSTGELFTEADSANYNYLLKKYLPKVYAQRDPTEEPGTRTRGEGNGPRNDQELMPYIGRARVISSIDPEAKSKILGPCIIFDSSRFNKYIFEQIYTTKKGENTDLTTHATYIVSKDFAQLIDSELFERDASGNIVGFNWQNLIRNYNNKENRDVIDKVLHKSKSWEKRLRMKVTGKDPDQKEKKRKRDNEPDIPE